MGEITIRQPQVLNGGIQTALFGAVADGKFNGGHLLLAVVYFFQVYKSE